jgi:hypothetical protein
MRSDQLKGKDQEEFDRRIRGYVYTCAMERGFLPKMDDIAAHFSLPVDDLRDSFRRLAYAHLIVLQRDSDEILMAHPFSAVPTPFLVELDTYTCYANCIWDALGISAMLNEDVVITTSCADCGTAAVLKTEDGTLMGDPGVLHFAVPAKRWWEDIVFT